MSDFMYINRNVANDTYIFCINRAGLSTVNHEFHIKRDRFYRYCVLHYVLSGSGWVKVNGRKYTVKKGDLFVLNAYQPHQYVTDWQSPLRVNWVEFSGGDCIRLVEEILSRQSVVISEPASTLANRHLMEIQDLLKINSREKQYEVSRLIYSMLICLLEKDKDASSDDMEKAPGSYIKSVLEYIDSNLDKNLNVSQLAKIACLDPTYFAKLFHDVEKITPAKYIMKKRICKAKEILAGSSTPVGQISDSLGFCSPSHFIKSFKKAEGLTPAEFREQCMLYIRL